MKLSKVEAQRFWAQVARRGPDECWLWTAKTTNVTVDGAGYRVHRIAYALEKKLPKGRLVLHTCSNWRCCNPRHLRLGRGRHRLTEQQIAEIRALKGQSLRTIARAYGVSHEFIRQLRADAAR